MSRTREGLLAGRELASARPLRRRRTLSAEFRGYVAARALPAARHAAGNACCGSLAGRRVSTRVEPGVDDVAKGRHGPDRSERTPGPFPTTRTAGAAIETGLPIERHPPAQFAIAYLDRLSVTNATVRAT